MTTLPQPVNPALAFAATYDAWNRLVGLSAGGSSVALYRYDGLMRRVVKQRYSGGVVSETRQLYYTDRWQALEERVGAATAAERQFVWGLRYLDDLVLRDRNPNGGGTLTERLYAMQDPSWNVTALVDVTGTVQERHLYNAYGVPSALTPSFGSHGASLYDWETHFASYRWDSETGLYQVRHRQYHPLLGCWLQRDPLGLGSGVNLYEYAKSNSMRFVDPLGGQVEIGVGVGVALALQLYQSLSSWAGSLWASFSFHLRPNYTICMKLRRKENDLTN